VVSSVVAGLLVCHVLVFQVCVVSGASMEPTLASGQRVLVFKLASAYERGDLVVFRNPDSPDDLLVKRVLALPGEQLESRAGKLTVGRFVMAEPYALAGTALGDLAPVTVPADHYYLVGDNRAESVDSRSFGAVDRRLVVGKVVSSLWSPERGS
jgi:signal peptidase I